MPPVLSGQTFLLALYAALERMSLIDIFGLDDQQRRAAVTLNCDIALSAGAGSGKTRTLVARYLHLLEQGLEPREIAAVTFTEKAAREMRNRIRAAIRGHRLEAAPEQSERWANIEADIDAAAIGTFHALCANILRSHPAEAGIDPQFQVLDEGMAAVWQAQAVEDALNWAVDQATLVGLFQSFTTDALADVLSTLFAHRLDIRNSDAAATRQLWDEAVLKRLDAFAQMAEGQVAINQLRSLKGRALAADAGDTLAAQIEGLRAQWEVFEAQLAARAALGAAQALFNARRDFMSLRAGKKTSLAKEALRELRDVFDASVNPWLGGGSAQDPVPDAETEEAAAGSVETLHTLFANALQRYEDQKMDKAALDFDDLEGIAARLLGDGEIRGRWLTQFKALLVDEFQDTNERQRQIVNALAGFHDRVTGRLFIVGDAKQSIYRFRGADVTVFKNLRRDIEARGGISLALDRTYRAHRELVTALNEMLGALMSAQDLSQPFAIEFAPLTPHRVEARAGIRAPFVEFLCGLGDSSDQARPLAAQLLARRLLDLREQKVSWDDVALLFRASSGFSAYEDALERAGIPFVTVAGRGFYNRPEIRDLLNILRALANPWDDLAMAGLLRSPAFGLSDAALYLLRWTDGKDEPHSFRAALRTDLSALMPADRRQAERARDLIGRLSAQVDRVSVAELIKTVLDETYYAAALSTSGTRLQRNLEKLLADAHTSGFIRVNRFLEYIETLNAAGAREGESPAEAEGAVRLMTVHRAKGLQFPVVVLADASRSAPNMSAPVLLSSELGLAPNPDRLEQQPLAYKLAKADDEAMEEAENLRLLYVAATRAEEKLIVCGHQLKNKADVWLLKLIEAAGINAADLTAAPGQWRSIMLPTCREQVGLLAAATVDLAAAPVLQESSVTTYPPLAQTLAALPATAPIEPDDQEEAEASPWRLAFSAEGGFDGALLGTLVHQAIRRWCFPGDPRCAALLQTAALNAGLADPRERAHYVDTARELLARFKADPRWPELDSAERHHEVPYVSSTSPLGAGGYLDVLYRVPSGQWRILDFKTDMLVDVAAADALVRGKYGRQLRRYLQAANQLLGQPVGAEICFLDVAGTVQCVTVDMTYR
jgi:ATP-dependent helicase/nuclease subunit A